LDLFIVVNVGDRLEPKSLTYRIQRAPWRNIRCGALFHFDSYSLLSLL